MAFFFNQHVAEAEATCNKALISGDDADVILSWKFVIKIIVTVNNIQLHLQDRKTEVLIPRLLGSYFVGEGLEGLRWA